MTVRWCETVRPEWVDYNGHLSEAYYVLIFGHATDAVMDAVGLDPAYRDRTGASLFTTEAHVRYLGQVREGDDVEVRSSVIGASPKVLWIWHEMVVAGTVRATEEILGVHVDVAAGRATRLPPELSRAVGSMLESPPTDAGRRIDLGRRVASG
jgi:acyl-CoA thioester hydrolase